GHRNTLRTLLGSWGYTIHVAADGRAAIEAAQGQPFDLILMDLRMPDMNGIEAMQDILGYNPAIPVVIMTAYSDVETAVAALKAGAYDYLTKPLDFDELKLTLGRALDHATLRQENTSLKKTLAGHDSPILGKSEATRRLLEMVDTIAPSEATVLITGESGTGKELVARLLHWKSGRAAGPFVTVNCAALTETLLESELFGHEKGAFTGAEKVREGRFRAADGGSIFLDEIGEMPLPMQAKLLRAIQEREIHRVGGDRPITVDVRIIAATNRDLGAEVEAGRFRQDLFYRLNVVSLHLPSLRERSGDVPVLADHFLRLFAEKNGKRVKGFTPGAMDRLLRHDWPGNVRELENTVERAVVLLVGEYVSERELPPALLPPTADTAKGSREWGDMTLEEIERAAVREVLQTTGGNKSEAARRLGITRKTLLAKLRGEEE
ncbi:MAG: sigma-54 dependent transcriptional regulator, partial [Planctomycetaceae bacterium]|nr:sigma-54 dependent transcriptional regulator [Planctomycetaceae bacterium]